MTENSLTVSVIIPTYNRAHLLERAVRSVLNQTYTDLEAIVVDDGSPDDTSGLIDRLIKQDNRIRYIRHNENRGSQAARNTGIRAARGDFVGFLDSDDEWLPFKLEKQMAAFASGGSKLGVVYAGLRVEYDDDYGRLQELWLPRYRGYIYRDALREWISDTSTLLVRKDILYKVGLWNQSVRANQEWDLCIRLARFADFDFIPEPLAVYYRHGGPTISGSFVQRGIGYLDVITCHLLEIIQNLGRPGLAKHLSSIGKLFILANNFKMAKACFKTAFRIWPFNIRPFANLLICSLGPSAYFKLIPLLKKWQSGECCPNVQKFKTLKN